MSKLTLNFIQKMANDGYLKADFELFGIPENEEQAEIFMANYQKIRNQLSK